MNVFYLSNNIFDILSFEIRNLVTISRSISMDSDINLTYDLIFFICLYIKIEYLNFNI
jgi:hypothetical protein